MLNIGMCDVCFHGVHVILIGYMVRMGNRGKNKNKGKEMLKLIITEAIQGLVWDKSRPKILGGVRLRISQQKKEEVYES